MSSEPGVPARTRASWLTQPGSPVVMGREHKGGGGRKPQTPALGSGGPRNGSGDPCLLCPQLQNMQVHQFIKFLGFFYFVLFQMNILPPNETVCPWEPSGPASQVRTRGDPWGAGHMLLGVPRPCSVRGDTATRRDTWCVGAEVWLWDWGTAPVTHRDARAVSGAWPQRPSGYLGCPRFCAQWTHPSTSSQGFLNTSASFFFSFFQIPEVACTPQNCFRKSLTAFVSLGQGKVRGGVRAATGEGPLGAGEQLAAGPSCKSTQTSPHPWPGAPKCHLLKRSQTPPVEGPGDNLSMAFGIIIASGMGDPGQILKRAWWWAGLAVSIAGGELSFEQRPEGVPESCPGLEGWPVCRPEVGEGPSRSQVKGKCSAMRDLLLWNHPDRRTGDSSFHETQVTSRLGFPRAADWGGVRLLPQSSSSPGMGRCSGPNRPRGFLIQRHNPQLRRKLSEGAG